MSGLSAGADAAYIYEEKFGIRDLEVNKQLGTNSKENGLDQITQNGTVQFEFLQIIHVYREMWNILLRR